MPSIPELGEGIHHALFLDLDGTLADIAPVPHLAVVAPEIAAAVRDLAARLDGALAIVSGRTLEDIDALMQPLRLPAAGMHGCVMRDWQGSIRTAGGAQDIAETRQILRDRLGKSPGILIEDKGPAIAIHYRLRPDLGDVVLQTAAEAVAPYPFLKLVPGRKVVEILPASVSKGAAIRALLKSAPFRDRKPIFAGDDVTDEDGFAAVNEAGGLSIKIGLGASQAQYRFLSAATFRDWIISLSQVEFFA